MSAAMGAQAFYDRLAPYFNAMTDWHARLGYELPFLLARLEEVGARTVLDAACGSGGHTLALAERGYEVTASDVSRQMLAHAVEESHQRGLAVHWLEAPLEQPPQGSYDAVLCLGNSLPHLLSPESLRAALAGLAGAVKPGGVLIIHHLNYDLRWKNKPRWFDVQHGLVEGQPRLIWRFADYGAETLTFNIALFSQLENGEWKVDVAGVTQRPIFAVDMTHLLAEFGLGKLQLFGSLKGEPFDPDSSPDLVTMAYRREH